ncbi:MULTISPECIES: diacylglycerol/lipid kinase family protein [Aequorivita]|uniref:Diacylglycerol kinase family lipid kinase n=1 Tax=Aequorivita iocasae TaxID=2803865 RepID=A0ABX7DUK9_9FLAO|nr:MULTISPECIES: diacylglycerol kinase family protein [Aequorivita]QQX76839.1 diacylglycerol kinase family lipid kinase [Aequorivita iocasae]UCA56311.1 diacylglycerol kinase family lipid kinase [Aequorivita sp. F7]
MKTKIHFIVNPIAGKGNNGLSEALLKTYFPETEYSISIKKTAFVLHATALTQASIAEGAEIIVACGGDGTINEVASCLVNTSILLGILPMGSGNGLASNLKIPKNLKKALSVIKIQNVVTIDTGTINGEPFFSNTGVGFDAHVISDFEENTTRQLFSYLKSTLRTLKKYSYQTQLQIKYNGTTELVSPFLLFISNSNEMGYKMSLTPRASLQDGLLDVVIVPKLSRFKLGLFTMLFLFKKHHWLKEVRFQQLTALEIKSLENTTLKAQKDGEFFVPKEPIIKLAIRPKNLNVCVL